MVLLHPIRTLVAILAAAALIVVPLANPLLVSASLIVGGVLAAWRGAADLGLLTATAGIGRDVLFRHRI